MGCIAIIPARGGSKGIKNKNLQLVGNKTLVARAILEAKKVDEISRIIVSTDSLEIEKEALQYGAEVHRRQMVTASDTAKTIDVINEVCQDKALHGEICVLLQPTSPLRTYHHIQQCIISYKNQGLVGSVITATECDSHPYKTVVHNGAEGYKPIRSFKDLESPRQQLPKALHINGAVYVVSFNQLLNRGSFFVPPTEFIEMDTDESIDIDTYADLEKANLLIKGN